MWKGRRGSPVPVIFNGSMDKMRCWCTASELSFGSDDDDDIMETGWRTKEQKKKGHINHGGWRWMRMRNISSISRHNSNLRQPWNVINLSGIFFERIQLSEHFCSGFFNVPRILHRPSQSSSSSFTRWCFMPHLSFFQLLFFSRSPLCGPRHLSLMVVW